MFSLLAFAGDIGCASGPAFLGFISSAAGDNLKTGGLVSTVFPVLLVIFVIARYFSEGRKNKLLPAADNANDETAEKK